MSKLRDFLKAQEGKIWNTDLTSAVLQNVTAWERPEYPTPKQSARVESAGDPCRHCHSPVLRVEHKKAPKYKEGGYYFKWWLRCSKCRALYMQEEGKVFFEPSTSNAIPDPRTT